MTPPAPPEQTTPATLAELVARLKDAEPNERADVLTVHAPLGSAEERNAWLRLRAAQLPFAPEIHIYYEGSADSELDENATPAADQRFQITVRKAAADGELLLFFAGSLAGVEEELASARRVRVAGMAADEAFETHLAGFEPWTTEPGGSFEPSGPLPNPRVFARDLTGAGTVPADVRPWLRRAAPQKPGNSYAAWLRLAARRVFAALADKVETGDGGDPAYGFTGPPPCTIQLGAAVEEPLGECLQKAGLWVFSEGRDVEARHLLLASEWARAYEPATTLALQDVCARAVESAHAAYDAYVRKESRETLEALAGLREAVIEETEKTRQRAQDLAGALWKDFAVAAAPFVLKILADAGKIPGNEIAAGLSFAAAAFLIFSFMVQVLLNNSFFEHQDDSRTAWQNALLAKGLTREELNKISVDPVEGSKTTYWWVRTFVGLFYAALVGVLLWFGITTLNRDPTPPPTSAQQADTSRAGEERPDTARPEPPKGPVSPALPSRP